MQLMPMSYTGIGPICFISLRTSYTNEYTNAKLQYNHQASKRLNLRQSVLYNLNFRTARITNDAGEVISTMSLYTITIHEYTTILL